MEPEETRHADARVLVERVVWPVLIETTKQSRESGVCDRLGPDDIVLTEDGDPRPVKSLSRRPLRQLHALLIDTSVSMKVSERLEHAKAAAIRYIQQLPADERVMVATFDDSLVLVSPPTSSREGLVASIEKTQPGNYTALWDALSELVRYLEVFPDQKTVVLLSDGEDSSSMSEMKSQEILDHVGSRSDLSIFPIGIDLYSHHDADQFRSVLRRVASATGGQFFETNGTLGVDQAFERLRLHLTRRFYATYEPSADDAPGPASAAAGHRRQRRVQVTRRAGIPCKVQSAGPATRAEATVQRVEESLAGAADAAAAVDALHRCLDLPASRHVTHERTLPIPAGWPRVEEQGEQGEQDEQVERPALYVLDPPGLIAARTPDVLLERGLLYSRQAYENAGRYRLTVDRKPRVGTRTVAIDVPEFDDLRRSIRGPEEVLLHLLQYDLCPDRADPRHPLFVHGKTFLEIREFIADALFEHYPDYQAWARDRLVAEAAPGVDAFLAELARSQELPAARLEAIRSTLMARAADPDHDAPQRFLAEWLGDVPARTAVQALEARLAGALLDPLGRVDEAPLAEHLERNGFGVFEAWFPPANAVRVLTPLLPAYDVARNVIGFYRIVLPRPRLGAPPVDPLPSAPLGLRTARFLLASGIWDTERTEGLRLSAVEHEVPGEARQRALAQQIKKLGGQDGELGPEFAGVVLEFADHEIQDALLELTAVFGADRRTPRLFSACLVGDASYAMHGLLDRLTENAAYRQLSCSAKNGAADGRLWRDPGLR